MTGEEVAVEASKIGLFIAGAWAMYRIGTAKSSSAWGEFFRNWFFRRR